MMQTDRYVATIARVDASGAWVRVGTERELLIEGAPLSVGARVEFELVSDSQGEHAIAVGSVASASYAEANEDLRGGWHGSGSELLPSEYPLGGSGRRWSN
jgi:hypothetical protein